MKRAISNATFRIFFLILLSVAVMSGCRSDQERIGGDGPSGGVIAIPHGYMARLEQVHDGRMIGFGPFVGYYFRPEDPKDLPVEIRLFQRKPFLQFQHARWCQTI
jgi:hypothetical protein